MLTELRVQNYRSLRDVTLPLGPINVIVGPNGSGKSNLYRAVFLLHAAASGNLARTLAIEGGMPSVLWAGTRQRGPVRLILTVTVNDLIYEIALGLPETNDLPSSFRLDPLVKSESVVFRDEASAVALMERNKSSVMLRDKDGRPVQFPLALTRGESVLSQIAEPEQFPGLATLRAAFLRWRFYHAFATDETAPLRQPQVGTFTPVLAHDGQDLAAALQTIIEIGLADTLWETVRQALGAELSIAQSDDGRFRVQLHQPGIARPLEAWELSDGTLRFLCLLAALLSPRSPALLCLNEPETSLHADVLPALAQLIVRASRETQVWITTHAPVLSDQITCLSGHAALSLSRANGETRVFLPADGNV